MRWKQLQETPITDIHVSQSVDDNPGFDDIDYRNIRSPAMQARYIKAFEKTPFKFEIFFDCDSAVPRKHDNDAGFYISKLDKGKGGGIKDSYRDIQGKPGVIRIVLVGNLSAINKMPLTPYILAHKIGHAFEDTEPAPAAVEQFFKLITLTRRDETDIFGTIMPLLTTRAARSRLLDNSPEEVASELIAQYLISGQVKLRRDVDKVLSPRAIQELGKFFSVAELEKKINNCLYYAFKSIEGMVLVEL